jgi:hypothetical protein
VEEDMELNLAAAHTEVDLEVAVTEEVVAALVVVEDIYEDSAAQVSTVSWRGLGGGGGHGVGLGGGLQGGGFGGGGAGSHTPR